MTALKRIASGSLAMWSRLGVTMFFQVALVPVYLSYWSANTYGAWLALQAIYALVTIFDAAHQNFLENEFLKTGRRDLNQLRRALYSAFPVGWALSALQIAILLVAERAGVLGFLPGFNDVAESALYKQTYWVLLCWLVTWMLTLSAAGLVTRVLAALGYYSRFAWWGLLFVVISTAVPALVLARGGDLLQVGIAQAAATFAYHLPFSWDAWRVMRKEKLLPVLPSMRTAISNLKGTVILLFKSLLELSRQHGFRIVMAPLVGLQKVAEFSTQRTVANVALQGLNSIYAPLMPELMRYIREREQAKLEGSFALLWGLLITVLCPLVVTLQFVMPVIYPLWTRGKFEYDAVLFSVISSSILIYAVALPAMAVCTGNNLVKAQLGIATVAALVLFSTLPILIHFWNLRGAALSLLCAEGVAATCYVRLAAAWLRSAELQWPKRSFDFGLYAVLNATVIMTSMSLYPTLAVALLVAFSCVTLLILWLSWQSLPELIRDYLHDYFLRRSSLIRQ